MSIVPSTSPTPPAPPVVHHTSCRGCGGSLETVIDLGIHQLNAFPETPDGVIGPAAPLVLTECTDCHLFQLADTVSPELLYREYWYRSGTNEMMRANLKSVIQRILQTVHVRAEDLVLDIGANDGTLLSYYQEFGAQARRIAVEPALNVQKALKENAAPSVIYKGFFPAIPLLQTGSCKVITSLAMFYDVEDPDEFVAAVHRILAPNGIWVLEVGYFPWMLRRGVFDMICHEHLEYYTLEYLRGLFARHNLKIIRAELNDTNGQSLRLVVAHESLPVRSLCGVGVAQLLELEAMLLTPARVDRFRQKVESLKRRIVDLVYQGLDLEWTIDLYGASTKGNTLLQYCGLGYPEIRQALDRSPEKWGRYTVGSGIPIVSEAHAGNGPVVPGSDEKGRPADLWLCPIWQFKPAILERERLYLENGGRILFPMPEPEIFKLAGTT